MVSVINGIDASDGSGSSVSSAGDVNDDGVADLIIGALSASPNGTFSGESYVVFGKNVPVCNGKFVTVDLSFGETPGPFDDAYSAPRDLTISEAVPATTRSVEKVAMTLFTAPSPPSTQSLPLSVV